MVRTNFFALCVFLAMSFGSCLRLNSQAEKKAVTQVGDAKMAIQRNHGKQTSADALPIVFMAFGSGKAYAPSAAVAASIFNEDSPVYVLVDDVTKFSNALDNLKPCKANPDSCARVQAVDVAKFQNSDREASFTQSYIHCSVNGFKYERSCFQRFFWLQHFMNTSGVGRALFLDNDILLTADVAKALDLHSNKPFYGVTNKSTYFSYWSLPALTEFCGYMQDFYARPVEQVAQDIEKHGNPNVHPNGRSLTAPKGWPKEVKPHQFSDMWMLKSFLETRPEHSRFVSGYVLTKEDPTSSWDLHALEGMTQAFGGVCWPDGQWHADTVNGHSVHVPSRRSGHKMIGMHFQGACKAFMQQAFQKVIG